MAASLGNGPVSSALEAAIAGGRLTADEAQRRAAERLDRLSASLAHYRPASDGGLLTRLFGGRGKTSAPPRGIYLWGRAGSGKTTLMDMFFATAPVPEKRRRRVHFHSFMQDVHKRINDIRAKQAAGIVWEDADPLAEVAKIIFHDAWLLCFDEFQVTDITDAMILSRLFRHLFDLGVVMVATSNSAPPELYKDGLNRGLFEPFIADLTAHNEIIALDGESDYRLSGIVREEVWITPLGPRADAAMDRLWLSITGQPNPSPLPLGLGGRLLMVPRAHGGVARFSFSDLCEQPLGAGDYLRVAQRFHTLFIDNIPLLAPQRRNEVIRLVTLVDALYENKVRLIVSAAGAPGELYPSGPMKNMFARAASRMEEMRRPGWGESAPPRA